ncbi:MAG: LysR family transcriptional regulator [Pseudomonadota bacterium]
MAHPKSITLKQLRALAAIVETGSITAAAGKLHVTPPAVSTQLKTLEDSVCAQVIKRGPDGKTALTPVGTELMGTIEKIESALEQSFERIRAMNDGLAGHISIGVVSTGKYFAPGLVADLKKRHPEIDIGLKVGNRDSIVDALSRGSIEMAIMGRPPQNPEVDHEVLGEHPYILIASPDNPLADYEEVPPEALFNETFLTREQGSGTRITMRRYLDQIGEGRTYRMIEMGTNETIKQAVMVNLGIAMISAHTIEAELDHGRLKVLRCPGLPVTRWWHLVHLKDAELSPTAQAFRAFLLELKGAYLPQLPNQAAGAPLKHAV